MAIKKRSNYIEETLAYDIITGSESFDRGRFFLVTAGYNEKALRKLEERVKGRALEYYAGECRTDAEFEAKRGFVERLLKSWFRPWNRLAGRMDCGLDDYFERHGKRVDEKAFADFLLSYVSLPEYKPYLDREFKGYVYNKCVECYLDYTVLPEGLRTPELTEKFKVDYPFCMEGGERRFLDIAYNMGKKHDVVLDEAPSVKNGYVGGVMSWSRYVKFFGPEVDGGWVSGLGFIDYKDCTNVYVVSSSVSNGATRAVAFDSYSLTDKRRVLERVFLKHMYGEKETVSQSVGTNGGDAKESSLNGAVRPVKQEKGADRKIRGLKPKI